MNQTFVVGDLDQKAIVETGTSFHIRIIITCATFWCCTMGLIPSGGFPLSGPFSRSLADSKYIQFFVWRSLCYASGVSIAEPHAPEPDFQLSCSNKDLDQLFHPGR